jgi:hypothetical protein
MKEDVKRESKENDKKTSGGSETRAIDGRKIREEESNNSSPVVDYCLFCSISL